VQLQLQPVGLGNRLVRDVVVPKSGTSCQRRLE
jgi:hypothetical protein